MPRSFDVVDDKLAEAEFFLQRIARCRYNIFALRCYSSAFVAASRSVTFAMQASMTGVPGFAEWYAERQTELREDPLARFFHDWRTASQHIGVHPVGAGVSGPGMKPLHFFMASDDLPNVPSHDVTTCCGSYFVMIVKLVWRCYEDFGPAIDPQQYYTQENFAARGLSYQHALAELRYPSAWAEAAKGFDEAEVWRILRRQAGHYRPQETFDKYLKPKREQSSGEAPV